MKVHELKAALRGLDEDDEVFILDADTDWLLRVSFAGMAETHPNADKSYDGCFVVAGDYGDKVA